MTVTDIPDPARAYADVPETLRDFDIDDQKFLAVAAAEGTSPPIFQALDHEWWMRRADLVAGEFDVQFLCVVDVMASD